MSREKYRTGSQHTIDPNAILPAIRGHAEGSVQRIMEGDRYDQYLSAKLDKAVEDPRKYATSRGPTKASLLLLNHRDHQMEKVREVSPVNRLQGTRSTPKLKGNSRSP